MNYKFIFNFIKSLRKFTDPRVDAFLLSSILIGLGASGVEVLFAKTLSVLLARLGLNTLGGFQSFTLESFSLQGVIAMVLLVSLFRSVVQFLSSWLPAYTRQLFHQPLRKNLTPFILRNPMKYRQSDLIAVYHEHVGKAAVIYSVLPALATTVITIALLSAYLIHLSAFFFFVGGGILTICLFPLRRLAKLLIRYSEQSGIASDQQYALIHIGLKNYFFLSLYSKVEGVCNRVSQIIDHVFILMNKQFIASETKAILPSFIGILVVCSIIFLNSINPHPTDTAVLIPFFYLFTRLANSLGQCHALLNQFPTAIDSAKRVLRLVEEVTKTKLEDEKNVVTAKPFPTSDRYQYLIKEASFSYDGVSKVGPISLAAQTGECLTIKGPSGVGKSTVLGMLMGVYTPQCGNVLLNQVEVRSIKTKLGDAIAYVGPEPYLIPGTLRENLLYCNDDLNIDDAKIWFYLEKVGLRDIFESRAHRLDEYLSDLSELSTGQKQRIGLCRAFLREAPILVLDEATANLDTQSEQLIIQYLIEIKSKTLLLISTHKSSFDEISDSIKIL